MRRDGARDRGSTWHSTADSRQLSRRQVLIGGVGGAVGLVAGCAGRPAGGSPDDQSYARLHVTAVYVAEDVTLSVPDDVPTVSATNNADLVILPDESDVGAEHAVEWLADGRVLAVLGEAAERTWLDWARSDPFAQTFDARGSSDAEPDPYLLVAAAVGVHVPTYRHSWSDRPRDRDILRALDEDLADIESQTPR